MNNSDRAEANYVSKFLKCYTSCIILPKYLKEFYFSKKLEFNSNGVSISIYLDFKWD